MKMSSVKPNSFFTRCRRFSALLWWTLQLIGAAVRYPAMPAHERAQHIQKMARKMLKILHIRVEAAGNPPARLDGILVVSNHLSWLDTAGILSLYPVSFVAKQEIARWPFLGNIVRAADSIFIDRSRRKDTEYINRLIAARLETGGNVAFFPEARTSENGRDMMPFKAALFESAIAAQTKIQPVAQSYFDAAGKPTAAAAYFGDTSFLRCVMNIIKEPEITLRLHFLPQIDTEKNPADRFALKDAAEEAIRRAYSADTAEAA